MHPFYFGDLDTQLFGMYHPPRGAMRDVAVLLCYPFGPEYVRAYRGFRQVANALANAGCHVLRFDYYGSGDSSGAGENAYVGQWLEDVTIAADELKDMSGVGAISVVGLRLGATLSLLAIGERSDVASLVLWDPVVSGKDFLDDLQSMHEQRLVHYERAWRIPAKDPEQLLGVPVSARLRAELAALDLGDVGPVRVERVALLLSEDRVEYERLDKRLRTLGLEPSVVCLPRPGRWSDLSELSSDLYPRELNLKVADLILEACV